MLDATPKERIYVAGHNGMVGSAIVRALTKQCNSNIITISHDKLDLTQQAAVQRFFEVEKPTQVYLAAALVGGVHANNTYPAEFIYKNIMIQSNVIDSSYRNGVKKLLFLGSSCIYPRDSIFPTNEDALLSGILEKTNEPYAIAKIAGIKLCESYNRQYGQSHSIDYRSIMPTNLFGVGDNYHPDNSHVIPGLIRKFHEGKVSNADYVTIWGTGTPKREFLYVDDLASACIHIMQLPKYHYDLYTTPTQSHINVGSGSEISILQLANLISKTVGYKGIIRFDKSKPDGTPRKLVDSTKINKMGWSCSTELALGLEITYNDFINNYM